MIATLLRWYMNVPAGAWFLVVLLGLIAFAREIGNIRADRQRPPAQ